MPDSPKSQPIKAKYFADTYRQVASTTDRHMVNLARAFRDRVALVKRGRR